MRHPYHIVNESPWPLWASSGAFCALAGSLVYWKTGHLSWSVLGMVIILSISYLWWKDVSVEAQQLGDHSLSVQSGIRAGMVLFISSEVMFFVSFFWSFFHSSLSPESLVGSWPPAGIEVLDPYTVPLLNTIVLLSSGMSITWSHHSLMQGDHLSACWGLLMTIILGVGFTMLQYLEYLEASFSMRDSVYGSIFFMTTGFHGTHVIIGSIFLIVSYVRMSSGKFSSTHHLGFECAAWYWHFVDVVWIFVYTFLYVWTNN